MRRCCLFLLTVLAAIVVPTGLFVRDAVSETILSAKRLPAATIPWLLVPDGSKQRSLSLTRADIAVDIAGYLAQTTVTLTFSNDTNRILESELVFPLPEGVTISGYGLDINGAIVDGVPVEKQATRIAFEKEVRKGVDPGLVEQTVGNTFRTRVYPIPAHGSRTLRLRWSHELETDPASGSATHTLRQRTENALESLTLHVSAHHPPGVPRGILGSATTGRTTLSFARTGDNYTAKQTLTKTALNGDFTVAFGPPSQTGPVVAVERFTRASAILPETFFTITDTVPNAPLYTAHPVRRIQRLGIIWDASLSRRNTDTNRECRILAALLYQVVLKRWDHFDGIEAIALMEAGRTVARARWTLPAGERSRLSIPFPSRLLQNLPCDTRVLMTWDTDDTDMDLWVTEPTGEKCDYFHNRTAIGGHLSNDFTQGYGPEEYLLRRNVPGSYRIQSNYYGTHQQKLTDGTTVQATVITDWGKRTEKRRYLTLRLTTAKETVTIGTVVQQRAKS